MTKVEIVCLIIIVVFLMVGSYWFGYSQGVKIPRMIKVRQQILREEIDKLKAENNLDKEIEVENDGEKSNQ